VELKAGYQVMIVGYGGTKGRIAHVFSSVKFGERYVGDLAGIPQSPMGSRNGEVLEFLQTEARKQGLDVSQDKDSLVTFHVLEAKKAS
jgi:hypothetical protein